MPTLSPRAAIPAIIVALLATIVAVALIASQLGDSDDSGGLPAVTSYRAVISPEVDGEPAERAEILVDVANDRSRGPAGAIVDGDCVFWTGQQPRGDVSIQRQRIGKGNTVLTPPALLVAWSESPGFSFNDPPQPDTVRGIATMRYEGTQEPLAFGYGAALSADVGPFEIALWADDQGRIVRAIQIQPSHEIDGHAQPALTVTTDFFDYNEPVSIDLPTNFTCIDDDFEEIPCT